jgi:hypothetical protein
LKNVDRSRSNSKNYQLNNPDQLLKWQLKKYGLTLEAYRALEAEQKGVCAICGKGPGGMEHSHKRLCVDHDHSTGEIRGLLCGACNIAIGHLNGSVELAFAVIRYLQNNKKENGDILD